VSIGENCGDVLREEFIDNAAKDITARIPPPYDVARIRMIYELKLTPTITVLLQELELFNQLLETMRKTLELLRKASNVQHVLQ
jgi:dynein heavy chain